MSAASSPSDTALQGPQPPRVEYPPGAYGRDFMTPDPQFPEGEDPAAAPVLQQIIDRGGAIISDATLIAIPSTLNTCYRDASLVGLLSLQTFLGYLDHYFASNPSKNDADTNGAQPGNMAVFFLRAAQSLWDSSLDAASRRRQLKVTIGEFWSFWQKTLGKNANNAQEDAALFLQDVLQELEQLMPQDTGDPTIFQRLFQSQFIGRRAFECNCPDKEIQPYTPADNRFIMTTVISEERPSVESALAWSIYDDQGQVAAQCPRCQLTGYRHRFLKFRYMPEVIFVQIDFIGKDKRGQLTRDSRRRCALPESIDLGALCGEIEHDEGSRDHSNEPQVDGQKVTPGLGDKRTRPATKYIYKLKFVVDYSGVTNHGATSGHYRCHVRGDDDQWGSLDGIRRNPLAVPTTLDNIGNSLFQPRLLAYELQHTGLDTIVEKSAVASPTTDSAPPPATVESKPDEPEKRSESIPAKISDDSSASGYDTLTVLQLRQEMTRRGIALPVNRKKDDHLRILQRYHSNPKDYALYTVATLKQLINNRDLKYEEKLAPRKGDLVSFLLSKDRLLPVVSTGNQKDLPDKQSSVESTQGDKELQDKLGDLQQKNNELQQRLRGVLTKGGAHRPVDPSQSSRALQRRCDELVRDKEIFETQMKGMADRYSQLEDFCRKQADELANKTQQMADDHPAQQARSGAQVVSSGTILDISFQSALLVSVKVQQAAVDTGIVIISIAQKYLLQLPGYDPSTLVNTGVKTVIRPSQGVGDTPRVDINVLIGAYRPGMEPDGSRQEVISIVLPDYVDANLLTVGAEVEMVRLSGPLLIWGQDVRQQQVSEAVGTSTGSKRTFDDAIGGATKEAAHESSKRQKL